MRHKTRKKCSKVFWSRQRVRFPVADIRVVLTGTVRKIYTPRGNSKQSRALSGYFPYVMWAAAEREVVSWINCIKFKFCGVGRNVSLACGKRECCWNVNKAVIDLVHITISKQIMFLNDFGYLTEFIIKIKSQNFLFPPLPPPYFTQLT